MVDSDAVLASTWKKGSQGFDHAPTVSWATQLSFRVTLNHYFYRIQNSGLELQIAQLVQNFDGSVGHAIGFKLIHNLRRLSL